MATVGAWTGKETRALRDAMRLSQLEFATELKLAEKTVYRWEAGGKVSPNGRRQLDDLLGRAPQHVLARFTELLHGGEDVRRRTLFKAAPVAAAGLLAIGLDTDHVDWLASGAGQPDMAAIDLLRQTLYNTMRLDDTLGSPAAQGAIIEQQRVVEALLRDCEDDDTVKPALQSLHAEAIGFAGALAWDAGEYTAAYRLYNLAKDTAHDAEDGDLAAYMLCGLSQLAIWEKKPRVAMDHAVAAQAWVRYSEDLPLQLYADMRMAEAAAIAGQKRACLAALDSAGSRIGEVSPGDPADSRAYFVGAAFYESYRGGCLTLIGEHGDAVEASRRAIAALPTAYTRDRAVTLLELERGLLAMNEVEEAAHAVRAAAALTRKNRSPRLRTAIRDGRADLEPWAKTRAVRELDDELVERKIIDRPHDIVVA
jgi:tetratricopeptide (TPR) repeat protein